MRCKCCDSPHGRFQLGDYYCSTCAGSIKYTISHDQALEENHEKMPRVPSLNSMMKTDGGDRW